MIVRRRLRTALRSLVPMTLDLLDQMEEVEREVRLCLGQAPQRPRLITRPRIEVALVEIARARCHARLALQTPSYSIPSHSL